MVRKKAGIVAALVMITAVGAFGLSVVAADQSVDDSSTQSDSSSDPDTLEFPERPATLTENNTIEYAIAYEQAYIGEQLRASHGDQVSNVDVSCEAYPAEVASDSAALLTLKCGYSYHVQVNGKTAIADGVPYTVTYRVDEETTHRTTPTSDGGGDQPDSSP